MEWSGSYKAWSELRGWSQGIPFSSDLVSYVERKEFTRVVDSVAAVNCWVTVACGDYPQRCNQTFDVRCFIHYAMKRRRALVSLKVPLSPSSLRQKIFIEQKALDTIAHLCDGDARIGLNSLQLAVQAQVNSARIGSLGQDGSQEILIKEEHIKEGLQRSHILYDKAGKSIVKCCPSNVTMI